MSIITPSISPQNTTQTLPPRVLNPTPTSNGIPRTIFYGKENIIFTESELRLEPMLGAFALGEIAQVEENRKHRGFNSDFGRLRCHISLKKEDRGKETNRLVSLSRRDITLPSSKWPAVCTTNQSVARRDSGSPVGLAWTVRGRTVTTELHGVSLSFPSARTFSKNCFLKMASSPIKPHPPTKIGAPHQSLWHYLLLQQAVS